MNLPFFPLRSYFETDLPVANPLIRPIRSPYGDELVYAVPPLQPDVTIVHAQRADAAGDTQVWGLTGCQKEAAFAADRVIVVVEELVARGRHPGRPQPDRHPRAHRRRGGRGAVRGASLLRPGLLRPRQPLLRASGTPSAAKRRDLDAWLDEWVHGLPGSRGVHGEAGPGGRGAHPAHRAPRRPARSTTGDTNDRAEHPAADDPGGVGDRSGTGGDPARVAANVAPMMRTAPELHRRGHLPVMGEWFALPLIEAAHEQVP